MAFNDPIALNEETDINTMAQLFRRKWQPDRWSYKLEGGENVICLVFAASGAVDAADAKALATWVKNQRPEILQGGAMYAGVMPPSGEFPPQHDVHFVANFELKPVHNAPPPGP